MKKYILISTLFLTSSLTIAGNLSNLPKEIQVLIMSQAEIPDIIRFCAASHEKKNLCEQNNELLYEVLTTRKFPNGLKPQGLSWEEFFFQKAAQRDFPAVKKPENNSWKEFYTATYDLYKN